MSTMNDVDHEKLVLVDIDHQTEVFKVRKGLGVLAPARLGEKSIAPFAKSIKVK